MLAIQAAVMSLGFRPRPLLRGDKGGASEKVEVPVAPGEDLQGCASSCQMC